MNTENPDKLIKDAMKIDFFLSAFVTHTLPRKKVQLRPKLLKKLLDIVAWWKLP